ncbi:MAG TPA: beta-galactosidase [Treponema sp.]|nr:beta-galactosidase [Treponema sp.]
MPECSGGLRMPDSFDFTPKYLTRNGEPWFPVMGEIHYSRCPADTWKDELLKMKAGGVNVVSTYTIWIHHEEIEGAWDFTGCRDLRRFVETCRDCGLYLLLRIGPWCHGEVRNGGFPDWLLHKGFEPRTNDDRYFGEVKIWYSRIYEQIADLLVKDNGPIIGVQIENEYGHCGGMTGEAGEKHMKRLLALAKKTGFDVPLYTATGWGGAVTAGMIPVMGGYVDAPWDQRTTEIEPSGNYVITHERNDHAIGSDFGSGGGITFDPEKYPYLTAELGGGLEPTYKRRPVPAARDIGAETLVKLASGVNLLGYYMYHGGTNPKGRLSTLQESKATGSLNDLPELSYDFFAPIGEYGRIAPVYGELKLYSLFAADFGSAFCRMAPHIPEDNPPDPENTDDVRYSWRYTEKDGLTQGYLFVNNYVRHRHMKEHPARTFALGTTSFTLNLHDGDYFFLPFNMRTGDALLEKALVTPLCILHNDKPVYVFYRNAVSETPDEKSLYSFKNGTYPSDAEILTLTRNDAEHAYKISSGGKEYLILTGASLVQDGGSVYLYGAGDMTFTSYPPLPVKPVHPQVLKVPDIEAKRAESTGSTKTYELSIGPWSGNDCYVSLYYYGNCARLYENGRLVDDNLFCGKNIPFQFGMKRYTSRIFRLEIDALKETDDVYLEDRPVFDGGTACSLVKASAEIEYKMRII